MEYQVRITPTALANAEDIYLWISSDNPVAALEWFNGLFEAVDSLSLMPSRCPVAPETRLVGTEIRCFLYKRLYRILFSVDGDVVMVHQIRHASRKYLTKEDFLAKPTTDMEGT